MSDDGFSDSFDELLMEVQIKTLMGTSFDIKVSSSDTVADIKKKIFRVEGIPVYNQNLIFRSQELKDSVRLCDYGIQNGSTLTLVTNMKGGPISTRRLSLSCEHHMVLKELRNLLENTRDEFTPGSKVSVLVFKEGDIINLLRVIENEDGSYSTYSENPISPPTKSLKKDSQLGVFQRLVEDTQMCTKIENLRKKMADASSRRQNRDNQKETNETQLDFDDRLFESSLSSTTSPSKQDDDMNFKFLEECASELLDHVNLTIFERNLDEENQSETEEVALKDKHRIKPRILQPIRPKTLQPLVIKNPSPATVNSLYKERKGAYSHTKQNYTWMQRKRESRLFEGLSSRERSTTGFRSSTMSNLEGSRLESSNNTSSVSGASLLSPLEMDGSAMDDIGAKFAEQLHLLDEDDQNLYGEGSFSMSARNRVQLTRLVLSEGAERPKSSPESMNLEELPPDLWEIHEPASDRLKHSATCKVGLLKHRQGLEYNYDSLENHPSTSKINSEISGGGGGNYSKTSTADYGVCSGANYFVPQFMSAPSAIPPQYAPKQPNYCDLYFRNNLSRSPLYSRKNSRKDGEESPSDLKEESFPTPPTFLTDCSSIQRLKNDPPSTSVCTHNTTSVSFTSTSRHSIQNISFNNDSSSTNVLPLSSRQEERGVEEINSTNLRLESTSSCIEKLGVPRRDIASRKMDSLRLEREVFGSKPKFLDELYGFYNGLSAGILERADVQKDEPILAPVITKKRSRCSECNKRLNITNIHHCRCGRIFCSQHRYSEVHRCTYDYKTEGRKILEHQNPLVTAEKIKRI